MVNTFSNTTKVSLLKHNQYENSLSVVYYHAGMSVYRMETDLKDLKASKVEIIGQKI